MDFECLEGIRSVILRRSEAYGTSLGFSIMGGSGFDFPPVIFAIEKDSPAWNTGMLEAGDVILSINEREVVKLTTKEVLKCLRLSGDIVHIKFKRDPHVVSRVREFISTPNNNVETPSPAKFASPTKSHNSKSKKVTQSQIPVYQNQKSPLRQIPNPENGAYASSYVGAEGGGDVVDQISFTNRSNISFDDELFVNHGFMQQKPSTSTHAQGNGHGKRSFETFVMTGDTILNLSGSESHQRKNFGGPSPVKIASKLTPMPTLPIFVERDKDAARRILLSAQAQEESRKMAETASAHPSHPHEDSKSDSLPPPPEVEGGAHALESEAGVSNSTLPPPPAPENGSVSESQSASTPLALANGEERDAEDTSISSSVMSDDSGPGGVTATAGGEEAAGTSASKRVFGLGSKKYSSTDSYDVAVRGGFSFPEKKEKEDTDEEGGGPERERYNEYILLNGSRGTLNDEDKSGRSNVNLLANSPSKTPSTLTGGHSGQSQSEGSEDGDSISEGGHMAPDTSAHSMARLLSQESGDSDNSDVESMRAAPVTKSVDVPSAERLAKRLYALDGFKANDVWRHLSKPTDFNNIVAKEYLKFFDFKDESLDVSLRRFLSVCPLRGETSDRERVLFFFSSRWVESNPETIGIPDSVHTLTCALMLLNTDITSGLRNQRMSCAEFIDNLAGLNDGGDFPKEVLKRLYQSIKSQPLLSPMETDDEDSNKETLADDLIVAASASTSTMEFKRGYLVRKSTHGYGGKKTGFGKRGWKMYFCRLKELSLSLSPDESSSFDESDKKSKASRSRNPGLSSSQNSLNSPPNSSPYSIKLHHAIATAATDYRKKGNVFRLTLADRSDYLLQCSEPREMNSWIELINWVAARFSAPALEAPCSSSGTFQRPLLPSVISRASRREQIEAHDGALANVQKELEILMQTKRKNSSSALKKEEKIKLTFYQDELRRYKVYIEVLEKRGEAGGKNSKPAPEEIIELNQLPNPSIVLEEPVTP